MSLLDDDRHTVVLYPEKVISNDLGNSRRVPDYANPVIVTGRVGNPSSSEAGGTDQEVRTRRVFRTRSVLVGAFASAAYDGRLWDIEGEPDHHDGSDETEHYTLGLLAQTAKPVT